jgi:hypothetical protein
MKFKLNNDLKKIVFSWHNKIHFYGAIAIAVLVGYATGSPRIGFLASYGTWMTWEVGDGFKPWYDQFKYDDFQPWIFNWLRENLLYSDGFSFQDAFVWNLSGALIGTGIIALILGG